MTFGQYPLILLVSLSWMILRVSLEHWGKVLTLPLTFTYTMGCDQTAKEPAVITPAKVSVQITVATVPPTPIMIWRKEFLVLMLLEKVFGVSVFGNATEMKMVSEKL